MTPDALALLIVQTVKSALQPVRDQSVHLAARLDQLQAVLAALQQAAAVAPTVDLAALRERLAVLETRQPVPGPPGRDGLDGQDGADGVRLDDLAASFDGDRTLTLTLAAGTRTKAIPVTLPIPRWRGVYNASQAYQTGDLVTWEGSTWHCQAPTISKPGDQAKAWQLMVKRGRDYTGRRQANGGS